MIIGAQLMYWFSDIITQYWLIKDISVFILSEMC